MACVSFKNLKFAYSEGYLKRSPSKKLARLLPKSARTAIEILDIIEDSPGSTLEGLSDQTRIAKNTVAIYCRALDRLGVIRTRTADGYPGNPNQYYLLNRLPKKS